MCKTGDDENLYDKLGIFVHLGINHVILLYIIGVVCNKLSEIDENTLLEYRVYQLKIQAMYIDYIYFQNNSKTKSSYNFYLKENWDLINELIKDLQPISCLDNDINSVYMLLMQLYDIFRQTP